MFKVLWYIISILLFLLSTIILRFIALGNFPSLRTYRLIQKLPGPKGIFLLGNAIQLMGGSKDVLFWLSESLKGYDRLMRLWSSAIASVVLKDPDDAQVLFSSTQHVNKGIEYIALLPWLEDGLLTSRREKWHIKRKLLTPAFHFKILEDNISTFNKCSKILCNKLKKSQEREVDIESLATLCTLDIIMETAMGIDLNTQLEGGKEYVRNLKEVASLATERLTQPLLFVDWIHRISTNGRKFFKLVKYLHGFSLKIIKERRNIFQSNDDLSKKTHRAFLDKLLEYEVNNPGSFSNKNIREEVDTFMFEGHDTTSVALVYALYALATHSDIQEKVYQEIKVIFGSSDRDVTSTDLNKMVYLEKVIKETLRLYPSVPIVTRNLDHDLILHDGVIIPAGTNVIALIYSIHRNEKYWDNPEKFDPERFSEEHISYKHPFAYIPFSAGPRNCIGQKFAMMELKTALVTIIRKFKVVPVTKKEDVKVYLSLVLRTLEPIKCRFVLR